MCEGLAVDPHKVKVRRTILKKKRPAGDTYRFGMLREVARKRRCRSGRSTLQLDGYHASTTVRWIAKDNCAYMSACGRCFELKPRLVGLFQDGARLGNPAKEHMLYVGLHDSASRGCVLPPRRHVRMCPPRAIDNCWGIRGGCSVFC